MPDAEPAGPRRPFQFGLATLLLIMLLVSVLAAALGGMLRGRTSVGARLPLGFFVAMIVAAPLAVMILLSLWRSVAGLFGRRRR